MIVGEKVGLRAVEEKDLSSFLEWRNKEDMRKFFREYKELNYSNQKNWFDNVIMNSQNNIMFSIIDLENDELIGACGLNYIDWVNRNADLSIYIGSCYVDDVFSPDAINLLLKYGFEELNLHRISVEVYSIDVPKRKLMESIGFVFDGKLRETHWTEGEWCDSLFYSILEYEFEDRG